MLRARDRFLFKQQSVSVEELSISHLPLKVMVNFPIETPLLSNEKPTISQARAYFKATKKLTPSQPSLFVCDKTKTSSFLRSKPYSTRVVSKKFLFYLNNVNNKNTFKMYLKPGLNVPTLLYNIC